jgi:hypothetical protein
MLNVVLNGIFTSTEGSGGTKGGLVGATAPYHAEKALNPLYYMHAPKRI